MSRPRIGITSSILRGADPCDDVELRAYVDAIDRAGGESVVLYNDAREALDTLDGLLVTGGVDVDPGRYGEDDRYPERAYEHQAARDTFEFAALAHARMRALPTLCICRGMQAAAVVFGGTLYQDLPSERGAAFALHAHSRNGEDSYAIAPEHVVRLDVDSALARILGTTSLATNSVHHQAVRDLPPAFRVVGRSGDGTIEAIEASFDHPFYLGVQWHPETTIASDRPSAALFAGFIDTANRTRANVVVHGFFSAARTRNAETTGG